MQTSYRNFGGALRKKASTAFSIGDFVIFDATGFIVPATGGTGKILGVCLEEVASTSTTTGMTGVTLANDIVTFKAKVTGGTVAITNQGDTIDVDATDSSLLDAGSLGTGTDFEIMAVLNSTTVIVKAL